MLRVEVMAKKRRVKKEDVKTEVQWKRGLTVVLTEALFSKLKALSYIRLLVGQSDPILGLVVQVVNGIEEAETSKELQPAIFLSLPEEKLPEKKG